MKTWNVYIKYPREYLGTVDADTLRKAVSVARAKFQEIGLRPRGQFVVEERKSDGTQKA